MLLLDPQQRPDSLPAATLPAVHMSYCTNIHPGESWQEMRAQLGFHLPRIKARVAPDRPFGIGLRLSALAARQLEEEPAQAEFRDFLAEHQCYVFTLNGFPFGAFHRQAVKEAVYLPDWRDPQRLNYSNRLAQLLAALLPPELEYGSVSTVPGGYRQHLSGDGSGALWIATHLLEHAAFLHRLRQDSGRRIVLALEPEPDCLLATSEDAVAFFELHLLSRAALNQVAKWCNVKREEAEAIVRRHLGVCLDACHAAVEYEQPEDAVARLDQAGIAIAKLQLSAGLRVTRPDWMAAEALRAFAEDTYLHQVVARRGDDLWRYPDLPAALAALPRQPADEWRIHFHVPICHAALAPFASTQDFLSRLLALQRQRPLSGHLEVETYSWGVLPPAHRQGDLGEAICRELQWAEGQLR
ncbi:metabolite traffic protein EboE [Chromobacterium haemolyticum]|uniref:metabolite traffic protein EboE n=1 Tax=Chromobacterium haemolyticum TaxID=394935 RepID=UPI0040577ADF